MIPIKRIFNRYFDFMLELLIALILLIAFFCASSLDRRNQFALYMIMRMVFVNDFLFLFSQLFFSFI